MYGPGTDIMGGGPVGNYLLGRDMVHDPTHQEGVGRIPPQGGTQVDREATSESEGRRVEIPSTRRRYVGVRPAEDGDLCLLTPEHSRIFYCDHAHYGPVYGGGADTGSTGFQSVVGAGRGGRVGVADGGLVGGTDEGG